MRPDDPVDEGPGPDNRSASTLSKYSLAAVCTLSLMAGGAAALAMHYAGQSAAEVQGVAVKSVEVGRSTGSEARAVKGQVAEGARPEGGRARVAGAAEGDEAEGASGSPEIKARRQRTAARARAEAAGWDGGGSSTDRRYTKGSGSKAAGGRGVAGHALGGVKKTGEGVKKTGAAIGKTFGKIGGVFNE